MLNFSCLCNLKMKNIEITYLNIKNNSVLCSLYRAAPPHATPLHGSPEFSKKKCYVCKNLKTKCYVIVIRLEGSVRLLATVIKD